MPRAENTERFTDRVEDYVRHRPSYPAAALETLQSDFDFRPDFRLADVGSGTGLLARLFLESGYRVVGVEPNEAMRLAGDAELVEHPGFESVPGTAEATTLGDGSVDAIVVGQAFHWFDPEPTKAEFLRILGGAGGGRVALIWNTWFHETTPLMNDYRQVVDTYALEPMETRYQGRRQLSAVMSFFAKGQVEARSMSNVQRQDREKFRGRLMSCSYIPQRGHPQFTPMLEALDAAFDRHQMDGFVDFTMRTQMFVGQL